MTKVFNKQSTILKRAQLRSNMTWPEQRLWHRIRSKQLGVRFRRQFGIGNYIVDFYSPEKRLVIELDGESHFTVQGKQYDLKRDHYLNSIGIKVLRFTNDQVSKEFEMVLEMIRFEMTPTQPPP
ncbi:DUF559 domain-containing protein [Marinomonas mediterranea]|uniref:endonuclease domain-containing protein n=1 Tax=Marinomonas mediterranea TaxID=119864 RepID=UPI002349474D|nr:endonuclease domain-containing protein [Marinomonas mediterranea]WCN13619.1 DUF559 domain-containing protein [Marinomonas mediterranea]